MDELAASTLAALKRSATPAEQQLSALNSLKSSIKHQRVAESAQPIVLECIRVSITSKTSSTLVTAGFATLSHFIKRLHLQEQVSAIFAPRGNILPILLEKLGEQKEAQRSAASQCLCDLWSAKPADIDNAIREKAIQGTNARAKETGMQWVAKMHREQNIPFRVFVSPIVECLDHADGAVRECAKAVVVDLFKYVLLLSGVMPSRRRHCEHHFSLPAGDLLSSETCRRLTLTQRLSKQRKGRPEATAGGSQCPQVDCDIYSFTARYTRRRRVDGIDSITTSHLIDIGKTAVASANACRRGPGRCSSR